MDNIRKLRLLPPLLVRVPNDYFSSRPPLDAGTTTTRMAAQVGTSLDAKLVPSPSVEVSTSCDIYRERYPVCERTPNKPRRPMTPAPQINRPCQPLGRTQHALAHTHEHGHKQEHARAPAFYARQCGLVPILCLNRNQCRPTPPVAGIAFIVSCRTPEAARDICASRQQCEPVTGRSCCFLLGCCCQCLNPPFSSTFPNIPGRTPPIIRRTRPDSPPCAKRSPC